MDCASCNSHFCSCQGGHFAPSIPSAVFPPWFLSPSAPSGVPPLPFIPPSSYFSLHLPPRHLFLVPVFFVPACPSHVFFPAQGQAIGVHWCGRGSWFLGTETNSLVFVRQDGEGICLIQSILFTGTGCSLGTVSPCAFVQHLANSALTKVCSGGCNSLTFVLPAEDAWSEPLGTGRALPLLVFCSVLSAGRGAV